MALGKVYFRVRHGRPRRWIGVLKIFNSEYQNQKFSENREGDMRHRIFPVTLRVL
jgi:hypothetical protein